VKCGIYAELVKQGIMCLLTGNRTIIDTGANAVGCPLAFLLYDEITGHGELCMAPIFEAYESLALTS
jgi:hypothetical protein